MTANASTDVLVGHGSMMVTVLSARTMRKSDLVVVMFFKFYFQCFTFAEIGFAGAQEVTLLIAKVKDQNLLGNVHLFVVGLLRFIAVSRKASQLIVYNTSQVKKT